jgi:hypothetical protein
MPLTVKNHRFFPKFRCQQFRDESENRVHVQSLTHTFMLMLAFIFLETWCNLPQPEIDRVGLFCRTFCQSGGAVRVQAHATTGDSWVSGTHTRGPLDSLLPVQALHEFKIGSIRSGHPANPPSWRRSYSDHSRTLRISLKTISSPGRLFAKDSTRSL